MPSSSEHSARQMAVLQVLYLVFNAESTPGSRPSEASADLATEAIRLTRMRRELQPGDPEVAGLLALMLLTDARRAARAPGDGTLIPLGRQDRTLWNGDQIQEGTALITGALGPGAVGPYQVQAAIARGPRRGDYVRRDRLAADSRPVRGTRAARPGPVVTLNRAMAAANVHGPRVGLAMLGTIAADSRIAQTHRLDAVRAHLLELAGDYDLARESCVQAMRGTPAQPSGATSASERQISGSEYANAIERSGHPDPSPTPHAVPGAAVPKAEPGSTDSGGLRVAS